MDLLAFLEEGIVLRHTAQGEFVHEVDLVGLAHPLVLCGVRKGEQVSQSRANDRKRWGRQSFLPERKRKGRAYLEVFDDDGEGCREEHDLPLFGHKAEELFDDGGKLGREELVGLVHDKDGALAQVGDALAGQVEDPTWRADEDVDGFAEAHDVVAEGGPSRRDHDVDPGVFSERLTDLTRLEGEFSRRHEEESLDLGDLGVDAFEGRDDKGGRLAGSVLGSREDIATGQGDRDRFLLDGRRSFKLGGDEKWRRSVLQYRPLLGVGNVRRPRRCP